MNNYNFKLKNKKQGQAAMEFLMTYGWALLVVLIAIAALAFFGLLNPSRFLPERCEIAPGLTCMDFQASAVDSTNRKENTITILLNNGIGQTMRDVVINVTECKVGGIPIINQTGDPLNITHLGGGLVQVPVITQGSTQKLTITNCSNMVANSRFRSDIIITYQTKTENFDLEQSKRGNLVVQVN
jgi:uncharacterized protein (UPF0333 family)